MNNKSIAILGFAFSLSIVSWSPLAQTKCSKDHRGITTCQDSNGNTIQGSTDHRGNTTVQSSDGRTLQGSTDHRGNTTWKDSNGNLTVCSKDHRGNTTCQ